MDFPEEWRIRAAFAKLVISKAMISPDYCRYDISAHHSTILALGSDKIAGLFLCSSDLVLAGSWGRRHKNRFLAICRAIYNARATEVEA